MTKTEIIDNLLKEITGDAYHEYRFGDNYKRLYHKNYVTNIVYDIDMIHLLWCIKSFVKKKITPNVISEAEYWFTMCKSLQTYYPNLESHKAMYFDSCKLSKTCKNKIYEYVGTIVTHRRYAGDGYYSSEVKEFDYGLYSK